MRAPGETRYIMSVKIFFVEAIQGAVAVCFAQYKKLRYIVAGFGDSRLSYVLMNVEDDNMLEKI